MTSDCLEDLRRAAEGDEPAQQRLVEEFSPLLLAQARTRLGPALTAENDAEDLVQDVWLVALQRLDRIRPRNGRATPVLVSYLSRTLLLVCNEKLRRAYRGADRRLDRSGIAEEVPAALTTAWQRLARSEAVAELEDAMAGLSRRAREVVVLRGFEQWSNLEVARLLDASPDTVSQIWGRAREQLRAVVPAGLWDDDPSPPSPAASG